jgi:hypothetical protein
MTGNFNKVFCLGLSRTGTTSLHEALRALGVRSIHFPIHLFTQPEAVGLPPFRPVLRLGPYGSWRRGKELKASRFHHDAKRLLDSHDAFCDLPVPLFFRELDGMFPGSKFILTTRDCQGWLKSMQWLLDDGGILWKRGRIGDELHYRVYGTTVFDRAKLADAWRKHHRDVSFFFSGRSADLLELRVDRGELGYKTLAGFLGMETELDGPCPRANEARGLSKVDKYSGRIGRLAPLEACKIAFLRLFGGK